MEGGFYHAMSTGSISRYVAQEGFNFEQLIMQRESPEAAIGWRPSSETSRGWTTVAIGMADFGMDRYLCHGKSSQNERFPLDPVKKQQPFRVSKLPF